MCVACGPRACARPATCGLHVTVGAVCWQMTSNRRPSTREGPQKCPWTPISKSQWCTPTSRHALGAPAAVSRCSRVHRAYERVLPLPQDPDEPVAFVGTNVEPAASECVLLFDGQAREFVLERLHTSVQSLRNVRVSSMAQEHVTARAKKRCVR